MSYLAASLLIGGRRREGAGAPIHVVDPATGEVISTLLGASVEDVDAAAEAAHAALAGWAAHAAIDREAILRRAATAVRDAAPRVAESIVSENGKPLAEAMAELGATADTLDFCAGEARRLYGRTIPARVAGSRMLTVREPVGVVAAFTPWNFPAINFIRQVAPALAAGCLPWPARDGCAQPAATDAWPRNRRARHRAGKAGG